MFGVQLAMFTGPLEGLLLLVERGDVVVAPLPLAEIVRQYVAYRLEQDPPAAERSEFIALAARLMLLKSRALLPRPPAPQPEPDDPAELVHALDIYRVFKEAATALRDREESGLRSYPRVAPPPALPATTGLGSVSLERLTQIVQSVLARHAPTAPDALVLRETVSLRDKIEHLHGWLQRAGAISFTEYIGESHNRLEVVVGFMAVLELIRRGAAIAEQSAAFGDITIRALAAANARDDHSEVAGTAMASANAVPQTSAV